jgi:hypothetical protein
MLRCTIELLPGGDEKRARVIGLVEICNVGGTAERGNYAVVLKKTPPFAGALRAAWRKGLMNDREDGRVGPVFDALHEDAETITASVEGHHRTKRGSYDLLYRALVACGLDKRAP